MPRTGRPSKPTALLKLQGGFRTDRHGKRLDAQVEVVAELPECPSQASEKVRELWTEIGAMLHGMGIMARPHTLAFLLLCDAAADFLKWSAAADIARVEPAVYDLKGKAWDRLMKACREFGMTPNAITSIRVVKAEEKPAKKYPRLSAS